MNMLNNAKAWLMERWAERTSWDGGLIIGLSLSYLLLGGLSRPISLGSPGLWYIHFCSKRSITTF